MLLKVMQAGKMLTAGVGLGCFAAACGDGDGEDALTKDEATALLGAMVPVLMYDTVTPIHLDDDSVVVACPAGGRARVHTRVYRVGWVADTFRVSMDYETTPNECELASGALRFTVGGDPSVGWRRTIDHVGRPLIALTATGSADGGVTWRVGQDRSGRCPIDLTLVTTSDISDPLNPRIDAAYRGRFCDHDIDLDVGELVY